ncbi:hypothetical protein Tco_0786729 [Tanacetum coccineum]
MKPTSNLVIEDVIRQLSFEESELDGEAGFVDVIGSSIDNHGLSHDESFGVDDLDLNFNLTLDLNLKVKHKKRFMCLRFGVGFLDGDGWVKVIQGCLDGYEGCFYGVFKRFDGGGRGARQNKATCKGQEASGSASREAQLAEPVVSQDGSGGSGVGQVPNAYGSGVGDVIGCSLLVGNLVVQMLVLEVKDHPLIDRQREEYKHKDLVHNKELSLNLKINLQPILKSK